MKKSLKNILGIEIRSIFWFVIISVVFIQLLFIVNHFQQLNFLTKQVSKSHSQDLMVAKFSANAKYNFTRLDLAMTNLLTSTDKIEAANIYEIITGLDGEFQSDIAVLKDRAHDEIRMVTKLDELEKNALVLSRTLEDMTQRKMANIQYSAVNEWKHLQIKERMIEDLEEINDISSEISYRGSLRTKDKIAESRRDYIVQSSVIIILVSIVLILFNYLIVVPIHRLSHLFRDIASGNLTKELNTSNYHSDVKVLSRSFETLQKKFLETLLSERAAKGAISAFLANMSHELRTPLNAVIGYSSLAIADIKEKNTESLSVENFETIKASGEHLLNLVNDILDLSKINSGDFNINNKKMDLVKTIEESLTLVRGKAEEKGLLLHLEYDGPEPLIILADPIRIKQIIINLVSNSIKFTSVGSVKVKLDYEEKDNDEIEIKVQITDTGIGIPADKVGDIFNAFTQAGDEISTQFGGTGLGLSITENLIKRMGGAIWCESQVGLGSTFSFTITTTLDKSLIKTETTSVATSIDTSWKVLVVEDDPDNFIILKHHLNSIGFSNVEHADTGQKAIDMATSSNHDLILMDMQLPDMTGIEATKVILSKLDSPPPIAALTANVYESHQKACIEVGMVDFVTKPISKDSIYNALLRIQKNITG